MRLSGTVTEICRLKDNRVTTLIFLGSRDLIGHGKKDGSREREKERGWEGKGKNGKGKGKERGKIKEMEGKGKGIMPSSFSITLSVIKLDAPRSVTATRL